MILKHWFLSIENEINYVKLLNGVLPDEIRAISWSPVSSDMSARFDCVERVYRYFLPKYTFINKWLVLLK